MDRAVFVFSDDLAVFPSLASAEGGTEVFDLSESRYLDEEGTVISAAADGYRVRLTLTTERRSEELRERLHIYLERSGLNPGLADDPSAAARVLMERQRLARWPRWLHRLRHR